MQSSDESDDNEKNGVPTNRGSDTEPDEVAKETPEEEVGELPIMEKKKVTYWYYHISLRANGKRMDFSYLWLFPTTPHY